MLVSRTIDLSNKEQHCNNDKTNIMENIKYYLISVAPKRSAGSSGRVDCVVACPEEIGD